mmetsp:Transcript_4382/g.7333  ORF Transcript_4382/g.7333 Transcript_4382/m.7333 type:complete len:637 (-) Transcript_4382:30-1940(-)
MVAATLSEGNAEAALPAFAELVSPSGRRRHAEFEALLLEGDSTEQQGERQSIFKSLNSEVAVRAAAATAALHPMKEARAAGLKCLTELWSPCMEEQWKGNVLSDCKVVAASLDKLQQSALSYLDPPARREASGAIAKLIATAGDEIYDWMLACLTGPSGLLKQVRAHLRILGVFVLESIMEVEQNPEGWKHLVNCLPDSDPEVRGMACEALTGFVSEKPGSSVVMPLLSPLLNNEIEDVRLSALEIAVAVARHEVLSRSMVRDAGSIAIRAWRDSAAAVQRRGLELFGAIEELSHLHALLVLANYSKDPACKVAWDHFADVWLMSEGKDDQFQDIVPEYRHSVRAIALHALSSADTEVLKCAVGLLRSLCNHEDEEVAVAVRELVIRQARRMSAEALGSLIGPAWMEGTSVHAAVLLCFRANWTVQLSVLEALGRSAPRGCTLALDMMKTSLKSTNADVRQSAVESIAAVALPNDTETIALLAEMRDDNEVNVQEAAEEAIMALQGPPPEDQFVEAKLKLDPSSEEVSATPLHTNIDLPSAEALAHMPIEDMLQAYDKVVSKEEALEGFVQWPSEPSTGSSTGTSDLDGDHDFEEVADTDVNDAVLPEVAFDPPARDSQEAPATAPTSASSDWVLI